MKEWKRLVTGWRTRARAAKDASGMGDADIVERVLELREARGDTRSIGRSGLNHWITRSDRDPNVQDFLDWCEAVDADPRHILFGKDIGERATAPTRTTEAQPPQRRKVKA